MFNLKFEVSLIQKLILLIAIIINQMHENFERGIIQRVKKIKCSQEGCLSDNQDTLELAIFGDEKLKRQGFMCTSCFIDGELIGSLQKVDHHVLPIRKFMTVLSQQYTQYSQAKSQINWAPNMIDQDRKQVNKLVTQMEKQLMKGMRDIVAYVDQAASETIAQIKNVNHDPNFEKINEMLGEQNQLQQERMDLGKELKIICNKIERSEGSYRINTEQQLKKQSQQILGRFRAKIQLAEKTLVKLIETQKRGIKVLLE